ncbi:SGNH/GDSL hydrolase family protein [Deminuibacter soli]|uniref:SGNH/GDSL hydrolase family protein n=1 Tax=Deminuibacter soli TaxID=2291815 RepID=A0A3E1NPZ5_9BACT|nr:SGNH/GDSL hydrolase family protein [Deminuibacter soli]RFM30019.1 SGNH/GDSL hydrolase family protein [Deminuibacter soli]
MSKTNNILPFDSTLSVDRGISVFDTLTGKMFRTTLLALQSLFGTAMSANFKGIADTGTNPAVPDGFYFADGPGTYSFFKDPGNNSIVVTDEDLQGMLVLSGNGSSWQKLKISLQLGDSQIINRYLDPNVRRSFAEGLPGKNMFDKSDITEGFYADYATGGLVPLAGYSVSNYIPVKPNTTYYFVHPQQVPFFDTNKAYISGFANESSLNTFTTPAGCAYVRISTSVSNLNDQLLQEGVVGTGYEPFVVYLNDKAFRIKTGKNLFNKSAVIHGYYADHATGALTANSGYTASDFIEVSPGTTYAFRYPQQVPFYDVDKNYISGFPNSGGSTTFTTPAGCAYVRISTPVSNVDDQQLQLGTAVENYEPYQVYREDLGVLAGNIIGADNFFPVGDQSTKNLFNKSTVKLGYYADQATGALEVNSSFAVSDFISVKPNTIYSFTVPQQVPFYDASKNYISGFANLSSMKSFTTPAGCAFIKISMPVADIERQQLEENIVNSRFESYQQAIVPASKIEEPAFEIQLPSDIYLIKGELFSIYWANVIKFSHAFLHGNYYVRCQKLNSDGSYAQYGDGYSYKWDVTPDEAGTVTIEIRIVHIYQFYTAAAKRITLHVIDKDATTSKNRKANIVTIGDSFTDLYGVSTYFGQFLKQDTTATINMIGLHSTNDPALKDDAWSGETYKWYTEAPVGYYRADRPLADQQWDPGWGENEPNGWHTGDTDANLTDLQRSHGYARNQFYNPSTGKFDFSYYINHYFPSYKPHGAGSQNIDCFVSFVGLNDAIWNYTDDLINTYIPSVRQKMIDLVESVLAFDPFIKVFLHTVTPTFAGSHFLSLYGGNFESYERAKYNQEVWNSFILSLFDTPAYKARGVIVVPTAAHFDVRSAILTQPYNTDKFNPSFTETLDYDIHPTQSGAKYIADAMYMAVYNIGLR